MFPPLVLKELPAKYKPLSFCSVAEVNFVCMLNSGQFVGVELLVVVVDAQTVKEKEGPGSFTAICLT
jgi:hypothetical protein